MPYKDPEKAKEYMKAYMKKYMFSEASKEKNRQRMREHYRATRNGTKAPPSKHAQEKRRKRALKYYHLNKDTINSKAALRNKLNPKRNRERLRKRRLAYMAKFAFKDKARKLMKYALTTGRLIKGCCLYCKKENVQAHHTDYTKPLEVVWMCREHHSAWHRVFKAEQ